MPSRPACLTLGLGLGAFLMGPVFAVVQQIILGRAAIDPNA